MCENYTCPNAILIAEFEKFINYKKIYFLLTTMIKRKKYESLMLKIIREHKLKKKKTENLI